MRKLTAAGSAAFIGKRILPVESPRRLLQSAWDRMGQVLSRVGFEGT